MDSNAPILDYASPRKRLKLRLPARSTLFWQIEPDEILLTETLAAKEGVAWALVFTLVIQAMTVVSTLNGLHEMRSGTYLLPIGLMLLQVPLMLLIIHQTWRKTLLTVRCNELLLAFTSPLHRRHYKWSGDDIAGIVLVETANTQTDMPLAELLITRCAGGEIRLFTDHPIRAIQRLVAILPPMLRDGQHPTENSENSPWHAKVQPIDPTLNAMETSARLVDLHHDLRNRPK